MCRSYHHIQGQCCLGVQPDSASSEDSSGDCITGLSLTLQPKRSLNKSASREPPVQFSLVQLCPTLCNPMDCSTPGLPVHHQLPQFTQTHLHRVGDAIQLSHPMSSPSPLAFSLSQHQDLFK